MIFVIFLVICLEVADELLEGFDGLGMAGMIAQDDGDETKTVVNHFAIVFQIVVLTCVDGVVVASL